MISLADKSKSRYPCVWLVIDLIPHSPSLPIAHLEHVSLGALGDSFYEYLLKSWLMTNKHDVEARDMYYEAMAAIEKQLLRRTSDGTLFITDLKNGRPDMKMQHLVSERLSSLFILPIICRHNYHLMWIKVGVLPVSIQYSVDLQ